jgi:GNAT superfamily N-acetyltransferase
MESSADTVNRMIVRPFAANDRAAVRRIACATAMMGEPSHLFFDGEEVLADVLTAYFTDQEPGSSFVAESGGVVVGYIIGAKDTRAAEIFFQRKLVWSLWTRIISCGLLLKRKNWMLCLQLLRAALTGRLMIPDLARDYPATLHINLLPEARGTGIGGKLMDRYMEYLGANGIPGVRMATMSESAAAFFETRGFKLLHRSSRPYFAHILGRDVPLLIYGRRLP